MSDFRNVETRGELRVDIDKIGERYGVGHRYWVDVRWEEAQRAVTTWAILSRESYEVKVSLVGPNAPFEQRGKQVKVAVVHPDGVWEYEEAFRS